MEDLVEDVEEVSVNNNNIKTSKLSSKSFKLKRAKWKKTGSSTVGGEEEDIPLEQGLAEGQEAIDLFFDNRFEDSRELANKQ